MGTCPACRGAKVDEQGRQCWGCNGHGVVEFTSDAEADVVLCEDRLVDRGTNRSSNMVSNSDEEANIDDLYEYFNKHRRQNPIRPPKGIIFDAIWMVLLITLSISFSPLFNTSPKVDNLKGYYEASYHSNSEKKDEYKKKIDPHFRWYKLVNIDKTPVGNYSWATMFSGNDDIGMLGLCISFHAALSSAYTSTITIIISSLIYSSFFMVMFDIDSHNILSLLFGLANKPTKSFFRYTLKSYESTAVDDRFGITKMTYIKAILAFLPGWLIGFLISYFLGELDLYFKEPLVPPILAISASFVLASTGGFVVIIINKFIAFVFLKFDIDILATFFDEIIAAITGILFSVFVFQNSFGATVSVVMGVLFFTAVSNRSSRRKMRRAS
jgi:hypothetical protein